MASSLHLQRTRQRGVRADEEFGVSAIQSADALVGLRAESHATRTDVKQRGGGRTESKGSGGNQQWIFAATSKKGVGTVGRRQRCGKDAAHGFDGAIRRRGQGAGDGG